MVLPARMRPMAYKVLLIKLGVILLIEYMIFIRDKILNFVKRELHLVLLLNKLWFIFIDHVIIL